jgi:hydroxymethylbilane synthase
LKKLDAAEFDAIILAVAGVNRLGLSSRITQVLEADVMLPAVGQGALGIETRANDTETSRLAAALDDAQTRACITAERALLHELQGGCQVPLGTWAHLADGEIHIEAAVFSTDGREFVRRDSRGSAANPAAAGKRLGEILISAGADKILRLAGRTVGQR